jgi:hypothetical protein
MVGNLGLQLAAKLQRFMSSAPGTARRLQFVSFTGAKEELPRKSSRRKMAGGHDRSGGRQGPQGDNMKTEIVKGPNENVNLAHIFL